MGIKKSTSRKKYVITDYDDIHKEKDLSMWKRINAFFKWNDQERET